MNKYKTKLNKFNSICVCMSKYRVFVVQRKSKTNLN